METGGKVRIVPATEVGPQAIVRFARAVYGPHAHQAREAYHTWLYEANPACPEGLGHMVVAVDEQGEVVGFVDRMVQTWNVAGRHAAIPAICDLALSPSHRKGGTGLRLILAGTRGVDHAFVNGSNPNSSPLFRSLKYQELHGAVWSRKMLAPLRGVAGHAAFRLLGHPRTPPDLRKARTSAPWHCTQAPDAALCGALVQRLNAHPAAVKLHWTPASFAWRFFHPLGPRHVLVHDAGQENFMLLSVGVHKGVAIARPVAYRHASPADLDHLLRATIEAARSVGCDMLLAFTLVKEEAERMRAAGFRDRRPAPGTFFHHRRRSDADLFAGAWVQGCASDLGLEAIP